MRADPVAFELGKDVGERLFPDLAHALRGQLESAPILLYVTCIFQDLGQLSKLVHLLAGVFAQQLLNSVLVDIREVVPVAHIPELLFQIVELIHAVDQTHRLLQ